MATYNSIQGTNDIAIQDPYYTDLLTGRVPKGFISRELLLPVPSNIPYGRIIKQNTALIAEAQLQLGASGFKTMALSYTATDHYQIKTRGIQARLDANDIFQLGGGDEAKARVRVIKQLDLQLMIAEEYATATTLRDVTKVTQVVSLSSGSYDDPASNPTADFATARAAVYDGCGEEANVAIVPFHVKNMLKAHPQLVKAYFQSAAAMIKGGNVTQMQLSDGQLAAAMGVEEIKYAKSYYNTAEDGQAPVYTTLWGKDIIFAHIADALHPDDAILSLGYRFIPASGANFMAPAEFAYDWTYPGVPMGFGKFITRGYTYDNHFTDFTCAAIIKNAVK